MTIEIVEFPIKHGGSFHSYAGIIIHLPSGNLLHSYRKSPFLSSVNHLFLRAMFHSFLNVYQRVQGETNLNLNPVTEPQQIHLSHTILPGKSHFLHWPAHDPHQTSPNQVHNLYVDPSSLIYQLVPHRFPIILVLKTARFHLVVYLPL